MLANIQDPRLIALNSWLQAVLPTPHFELTALRGDASFRRYFRAKLADQSFIVMDAPPAKENIRPFVAIAKAFAKLGISVPEIFASDFTQGFLLLTDLGDALYLDLLNEKNVDHLYEKALAILPRLQICSQVPEWQLPNFDQELILKEWQLFHQWHLSTHWRVEPNTQEQYLLTNTFEFLLQEILLQPRVCVHRDYHSRNLLSLNNGAVGVLDFQDAVWGPVAYDAVSLLRDCYIVWPREQVMQWVGNYYEQTYEHGLIKKISRDEFVRGFDLLGVQRHLKALGIFTRLNYLYGKPNYLNDVPRTLNYVLQVSEDHPELKKFHQFLLQNFPPSPAGIGQGEGPT